MLKIHAHIYAIRMYTVLQSHTYLYKGLLSEHLDCSQVLSQINSVALHKALYFFSLHFLCLKSEMF